MNPFRRSLAHGPVALAGSMLLGRHAIAADATAFPARPISLIVSYPPGGGADLMARLIAPRLADLLGQPVVVENRPGASGQIAAGAVAKAAADGHTLLFDASSYATTPALFPKSPYQGGAAFRPVAITALFPNVVLVNPSFPAKTVAELIVSAVRHSDGGRSILDRID